MTVHVMFDLETWGTTPGSALRSIGAVVFSPYDETADIPARYFYANIDEASCLAAGLKVDAKTAEWWARQSAESAAALLADQKSLPRVVDDFTGWWHAHDATYVWCNGAGFDEVLWSAACRAINRDVPWKYDKVRDTRTCWHLARLNPKAVPRSSVAHHALDDARHQALCVTKAYAILNVRPAAG